MESVGESEQKIILAIIACAACMATLDSTIVNISLPTISSWFSVDIGTVSWVVMAYLLALSGLMLAFGRLGDIRGFRTMFITGFAIFTAGSLLCGLSENISQLIFCRILQGAGAAACQAISPAMIALYLPEKKRGWALGILMTIVSLGIAGGPVLGGSITEYLGWHWIFFINVPIGILGVGFALRYLPRDTPGSGTPAFDVFGAVLILLALITLLFPLNQGFYLGWMSPLVTGSAIASALLWIVFLYHEKRTAVPLIEMSLFSSRSYLYGNVAGMLLILTFAGTEFLLPFYLEIVHGYSTEIAGMFLAIPAVTLMIAGPVAGTISDRQGSGWLMVISALMACVAMVLYSLFSETTSVVFLVATLVIEGWAIGMFMPPNMSLILSSADKKKEGVSSGVMMTLRNVGGAVGIALFGSIAMGTILMTMEGQYLQAASGQVMTGISHAFIAGILICIIVAIISGYLAGTHDEQRGRDEQAEPALP